MKILKLFFTNNMTQILEWQFRWGQNSGVKVESGNKYSKSQSMWALNKANLGITSPQLDWDSFSCPWAWLDNKSEQTYTNHVMNVILYSKQQYILVNYFLKFSFNVSSSSSLMLRVYMPCIGANASDTFHSNVSHLVSMWWLSSNKIDYQLIMHR